MQLTSKIRFYLPIGFITALLVYLMAYNKVSSVDFIISASLYFLVGLFLGWRVECKTFLATFLILLPLTLFAVYTHFMNSEAAIKYIYAIVLITFVIGFFLSKYWNAKPGLMRMGLILLLLAGIYSNMMLYSKAMYGNYLEVLFSEFKFQ
ncbi:MAG: hypothetical protein ACT4ON_04015 [Bacteroidota bacterium]